MLLLVTVCYYYKVRSPGRNKTLNCFSPCFSDLHRPESTVRKSNHINGIELSGFGDIGKP